jgi:hypothetical protein
MFPPLDVGWRASAAGAYCPDVHVLVFRISSAPQDPEVQRGRRDPQPSAGLRQRDALAVEDDHSGVASIARTASTRRQRRRRGVGRLLRVLLDAKLESRDQASQGIDALACVDVGFRIAKSTAPARITRRLRH